MKHQAFRAPQTGDARLTGFAAPSGNGPVEAMGARVIAVTARTCESWQHRELPWQQPPTRRYHVQMEGTMQRFAASPVWLLGVLTLATSQGCGKNTSEVAGVPRDQDAAVDVAASPDASPGITLLPACGDELGRQAAALVTAAVSCFVGRVDRCANGTGLCAWFDLSSAVLHDQGDAVDFSIVDKGPGNRIAELEQTATAALQGMATGGDCRVSVTIDNPDFDKLRRAILDCTGIFSTVGLDGNGTVSDVPGDSIDGGDTLALTCILEKVGNTTFPCLANTKLRSSVWLD